MAQIEHPDEPDDSIEVDVIDTESHRGHTMLQVQASADGVELSDECGNAPWLFEDEVDGYEVLAHE